jgi:hypothetical protein
MYMNRINSFTPWIKMIIGVYIFTTIAVEYTLESLRLAIAENPFWRRELKPNNSVSNVVLHSA